MQMFGHVVKLSCKTDKQLMKFHKVHVLFVENNLRYNLFDVYTELHSYIKYKNLNEKVFTNVQNLRLYYINLTINKNFVQSCFDF